MVRFTKCQGPPKHPQGAPPGHIRAGLVPESICTKDWIGMSGMPVRLSAISRIGLNHNTLRHRRGETETETPGSAARMVTRARPVDDGAAWRSREGGRKVHCN